MSRTPSRRALFDHKLKFALKRSLVLVEQGIFLSPKINLKSKSRFVATFNLLQRWKIECKIIDVQILGSLIQELPPKTKLP